MVLLLASDIICGTQTGITLSVVIVLKSIIALGFIVIAGREMSCPSSISMSTMAPLRDT